MRDKSQAASYALKTYHSSRAAGQRVRPASSTGARARSPRATAEREQHALEAVREAAQRRRIGAQKRRRPGAGRWRTAPLSRDGRGRARGRRRSGAPPWPARLRSGRRFPLRPPVAAGGGGRADRITHCSSSVSAIGLPSWRPRHSPRRACMAAFSPALNTASRAAHLFGMVGGAAADRPVSPGIIRSVITSAKRPAAGCSRACGRAASTSVDLEFLQRQRESGGSTRRRRLRRCPRSHDSAIVRRYVSGSPRVRAGRSGPALGPRHAVGDAAVPARPPAAQAAARPARACAPPARRPARRRRARAALVERGDDDQAGCSGTAGASAGW